MKKIILSSFLTAVCVSRVQAVGQALFTLPVGFTDNTSTTILFISVSLLVIFSLIYAYQTISDMLNYREYKDMQRDAYYNHGGYDYDRSNK